MAANKVRIFLSTLTTPWENLALEEMFMNDREEGEWRLLLWRSTPAIVMGRFQNPWVECNTKLMRRDGIDLARRLSGGGTVYHDLGNLCFSFFGCREDLDKGENLQFIVRSIERLGIPLQTNERCDLILGDKKVSGSAFKYKRRCALHHGTLLVSSDLDSLSKYLSVEKRQIFSKATQSVASKVANISGFGENIDIDGVIAAIYRQFCLERGNVPMEVISERTLESNSAYLDLRKKFKSPDWVYGETPRFTQRISATAFGSEAVWELDGRRGRIHGARIVSLKADNGPLLPFATYLTGKTYSRTGIKAAQTEMEAALPYARDRVKNFCKGLLDAIG